MGSSPQRFIEVVKTSIAAIGNYGILRFNSLLNHESDLLFEAGMKKRKDAMIGNARLVFLILLLVTGLTTPLGAQLEEAVRVPWPGFQVLKGRWQASNGVDVLEIKNISATGRMEVLFFRPEPAPVPRAQAARDGKVSKVLIELRDPASPCCMYDLTYDPARDRLKGRYWLKGRARGTDIVFDRLK
jgi:hypothetical protein